MAVVCPKCRFVRPADTSAPDWQCPCCGVAYAKFAAGDDAAVTGRGSTATSAASFRATPDQGEGGLSWGKVLLALLVLVAVWSGARLMMNKSGATPNSLATHLGGAESNEKLASLAATVNEGDVIMYSAAWCGNCAAAKQWMAAYGFKYQECDVDVRADCASEFRSYGADGVPYLIVKGHHMKDGFDSDEFVAALRGNVRSG